MQEVVEKKKLSGMRWWVLAITSIASFMVALDAQVVSTALNTMRLDFHTTIQTLQWTVNAYNLSFAVLLLTGAAMGERFGRKRIFMSGLMLFTLASVLCAVAPNIQTLIAARVLQGVGAALIMPLAMTLLGAAFPGGARAKALGIYSSITGLAVLGGPVIGGAITQGISWPWIFWINVPIGIVALLASAKRIERHTPVPAKFDIVGVALIALGVMGIVWGLIRGNTVGWGSAEVLSTLIIGAILTGMFVLTEFKSRQPMLPMGFFRLRAFSAGNASSFLLYATLYASVFFLAQFLQNAKGYGPLSAGLHLLPWTATLFVIAPFAGKLVVKTGERPLVMIGLALQAIGLWWIGQVASPGVAYSTLVAPFIIAGTGVSLVMPAVQHAVLGSVERHHIGRASGVFNMFRFLGGVFGVTVGVVAFSISGNYMSAQHFSEGFSAVMLASSGLAILGAVIALALPKKQAAPSQ